MSEIYKNILFSQSEYQKQLDYWTKQLEDDFSMLDFPVAKTFVDGCGSDLCNTPGTLPQELILKIDKLTNSDAFTTYIVLLTALKIFLFKYTSAASISVLTPVFNPENAEFYNELLILTDKIEAKSTFKELLMQVKNTVVSGCRNQDYPIEMIMKKLGIQESVEQMLSIGISMEGLQHTDSLLKKKPSLSFTFRKTGSIKEAVLYYNPQVVSQGQAEVYINKYVQVLQQCMSNLDNKIEDITLLSKEEKDRILYKFNDTFCERTNSNTFGEMFENICSCFGSKIAVVAEKGKKLTYRELNERSNQLGRTLISKGIGKKDIVGISLEASVDMIIAILAVVKTGAAYMPVEPTIPKERFDYISGDSKMKLLIANKQLEYEFIVEAKENVIFLDENAEQIAAMEKSNLNIGLDLDDLIYVIYTSGTTGVPKGVKVKHRGIWNYLNWFRKTAELSSEDKTMLISSFAFDLGYTALYSSLVNGCELHLLKNEEYTDPNNLLQYIRSNGITYIKTTPSLFSLMTGTELFKTGNVFKAMRLCVLGGEMIRLSDVEELHSIYPWVSVLNHYGPTETTIGVIAHKLDFSRYEDYKKQTVIGKPIDNVSVYILDKAREPLPTGEPGEIYISGECLAEGYVNNMALTNEKFIGNPFVETALMYRTGDKGCFTEDGSIQFLGRIDNQVKIRGYRVELEEIKNVLMKYDEISDCLVVLKEDQWKNSFLCAYIVSEGYSLKDIRQSLKKQLPDYMIPSYFVNIPQIPLTGNGKVNYKALPAPAHMIDTGVEYVAPGNEIESAMVDAWQEVLNVKKVGVLDDFFVLGGDSIKAIQVSTRLQNVGIQFNLKDFMQYPTIKEVAQKSTVIQLKSSQEEVTGKVQVTPVQESIYHSNVQTGKTSSKAALLQRPEGFDPDILNKVFDALLLKHDLLRAVYSRKDSGLNCIVNAYGGNSIIIESVDLGQEATANHRMKKEVELLQNSMDYSAGPLLKTVLFRKPDGDCLAIVAADIIANNASFHILLSDFCKAYSQLLNRQELDLGEKTFSFQQYTQKLNKEWIGKITAGEKEYWQNIENTKVCRLPKDCEPQIGRKSLKGVVRIGFGVEEAVCIENRMKEKYNTGTESILLCALGLALQKWTVTDIFKIDMVWDSRENKLEHYDFAQTVGNFDTAFPIVLNMEKSMDLNYQLKAIKETLMSVPHRGLGYSILKAAGNPDILWARPSYISYEFCEDIFENIHSDICSQYTAIDESNISNISTAAITYSLEVKGIVREKTLEILFRYGNDYEEAEIRQLGRLFEASVHSLVSYCNENSRCELTPSDVTCNQLSIDEVAGLQSKYEDRERNLEIEDICDPIPMEIVMFNTTTNGKGITPYYHNRTFTIENDINLELFNKGFNLLIDRYDVLRSVYDNTASVGLVRMVYKHLPSRIYYEDVSYLSPEEAENYFQEFVIKDGEKGFCLDRENLTRVSIIKTGDKRFRGLWSNHHLILDGWSKIILVREFLQHLTSLKEDKPLDLESSIPFSEYVKWYKKQDIKETYRHFESMLKGYDFKKLIPLSEGAVIDDVYTQENVYVTLDEKLTSRLLSIAKDQQSTLSSILRGAWSIFLQKLNDREDVVFGSIVSGRVSSIPDMERRVGSYINMIPVRLGWSADSTFEECLKIIQQQFLASERYAYFALDAYKGSALKNVFDTALIVENYPIGTRMKEIYQGRAVVSDVNIFDQTHCNFCIFVTPFETTVLKFAYNSRRYSAALVEEIAACLEQIIRQVADYPGILVRDIAVDLSRVYNMPIIED